MSNNEEEARPCPGLTWGPFTLRVPFVHTRIEWPEFAQGIFVAGATGLGLVPLLTADFGLTFDQAIASVFLYSILISSSTIVFGVPFAPGWITPALPLVLIVLDRNVIVPDAATAEQLQIAYETRFQLMAVMSLNFAALLFFMSATGLGRRFVEWIPPALKAGIIMGASIAALKRVFIDDAPRYLNVQPWTTVAGIAVCLILTFSVPLQRYREKYRALNVLCTLGLLPGFVAAAVVGLLAGEISYAGFSFETWIVIPPFMETFYIASPLSHGFTHITADMFVDTLVIAVMTYVIFFGDLVTGLEVLKDGQPYRPDDPVEADVSRVHLSAGIRNALMAVLAPFFPTQGILWTGVHVIIVQRWKRGRGNMQSLYSGIASYYVFGVPVLYMIVPLLLLLKPLMGVALSLTLVLTGFACAYVAMAIPRTQIERGVVILTGVSLAVFASPWIGMAVGIAATYLLVGGRALEAGEDPL